MRKLNWGSSKNVEGNLLEKKHWIDINKSWTKFRGVTMNSSKKVLIVDDAAFAHNIYRVLLGFMNLSILSAKSGSEAIDMISKEGDIGFVILDLNMPSMNGLELLEMFPLRFKEKTPVMVVSSDRDKVKQQTALKLGAVKFFEKSKLNELKQFLKHLIETPSMVNHT